MSGFINSLENTVKAEKTLTENGAVAYKTSGSALVDMNFSVSDMRNLGDSEIVGIYAKAFSEDMKYALRWLFYLRDIRGGLGERRSFRIILKWLAGERPEIVKGYIPHIADYGRFDDLLILKDTPVWEDVKKYLLASLTADMEKAEKEEGGLTLLAKWLPSINATSNRTKEIAKDLIKTWEWSERKYRKTLSSLRKRIDVLEKTISENRWGDVDYSHVPSKANLLYKNAFMKHDATRRREFLSKVEKGETKINSSTNTPPDIVSNYINSTHSYDYHGSLMKDAVLEELWKSLPKVELDGNILCVIDTSGSMTWTTFSRTRLRPLDVAVSLGIYTSEVNKSPEFKEKAITFSGNPEYFDLSGCSSLSMKLTRILSGKNVGMNTDIEKVMDLILKTAVDGGLKNEEIPTLVILSDMQFDEAKGGRSEDTLFEHIEKKYAEKGYEIPRIVFWNLNGGPVPLKRSKNGLVLMSGFSQNSLKMVMSGKLNPWDVLKEALDSERYSTVDAWGEGIC